RIQQTFEVDISLAQLFQAQTIQAQALLIAQADQAQQVLIPTCDHDRPLPLSFAQRRLWFIDQLQPASAQYNMPMALRLQGQLDTVALQQALSLLLQRHAILRTVYATDEHGEGVQIIRDIDTLPVATLDLTHLDDSLQMPRLQQLAREDAQTPFDLSTDIMLRVSLISLAPQQHALLFNMHHIASDGWSMGVMVNEFVTLYRALTLGQSPQLPALAIQYADYAVWQRANMDDQAITAELSYWQSQLKGIPVVHGLNTDTPRPTQPSNRGETLSMSFAAQLAQAITDLAHAENVTPFILMQAAFALLMGRWSGDEEIVVGTPIAGRTKLQLEPLIGFFVNNLVLRNDLSGNPSFIDYLAKARTMTLDAYQHQALPFEMLVEKLSPTRNLSHPPLFQLLFSLQNNQIGKLELPDLTISEVENNYECAKFDISVQVSTATDNLEISWIYNTDIFNQSTIMRMAEAYQTLLTQIISQPAAAIHSYTLVTAPDTQVAAMTYPLAETRLHRLFEQQVARQKQLTAVKYQDQLLSYNSLNQQANRLARYLITQGLQPGDFVGLYVQRSLDMIVALLAILKAGAAYLPVDPASPKARCQYILQDAKARIVVTSTALSSDLASEIQSVCLDSPELQSCLSAFSASNLADTADATDEIMGAAPAYVIYTSGSTGNPKGVVVQHKNVLRLFLAGNEHFAFGPSDCWTLFHSIAFDFSVWELWGALLYGGRLIVVPYDVTRSVADFHLLLQDEQVTVLNQTPSAFYMLADQILAHQQNLPPLRYVIFGGEALEPKRLQSWMHAFGDQQVQMINMYGITETTVHVTYRRISQADCSKPLSCIGRPLADLTAYVCNPWGVPQPVGAPGELLVGGDGVTPGYLNRPELTRERFIDNPFGPGKLYRSGDLVRRLDNGELEYLGRMDHQTKLRGFRIELGEIEHSLLGCAGIQDAVVLLKNAVDGHAYLAAFLVLSSQEYQQAPELDRQQLRDTLLQKIPAYMVPSNFVIVDSIPLTGNGKADRKALLALDDLPISNPSYMAPATRFEAILCDIWQQVLGLATVGVTDNFFAIGGDSIRVIQVLKKAELQGFSLTVKDVFLHQNIAQIARHCQHRQLTVDSQPVPMELLEQDFNKAIWLKPHHIEDGYPVTSLQKQMLLCHDSDATAVGVYQPSVLYRLDDIALKHEILQKALSVIVNRHPALRTHFARNGEHDFVQLVNKHLAVPLPLADLSHLKEPEQEQAVNQLLQENSMQRFALGENCIRFSLVKFSHLHWGLLISCHHAVIDGWALVEIRNELLALYPQLLAGKLTDDTASNENVFKQHVALELEARHCIQHKLAWQQLLSDYVPMPALPSQTVAAVDWLRFDFTIDSSVTADLNHLAVQLQIPLKTLLLHAYQTTLAKIWQWSGITVDVVTSGRSNRLSDPFGGIGLFWNLLPVTMPQHPNRLTCLQLLAQRLLNTDSHALYPRDKLLAMINQRDFSPAAFNYVNFHNAEYLEQQSGGANIRVGATSDKFDYPIKLAMSAALHKQQLSAQLEVNPAYMTADDAEHIVCVIRQQLTDLARLSDSRQPENAPTSLQESTDVRN
ncbi:amino acid adenylation domain-containing protein, partial [Rheinheimera baltica]|uniref:non-ribosomal peptide synthetase n=1 Tax=Rheinheimera baltica TaxID=67576 RepID=UPI00273E1039